MLKKSKRKRNKFKKIYLGRWIFIAGLVLLSGLFIQGDFGLLTRIKLIKRKHELEKKIAEEERKQALLKEKIHNLENDEKALERQVREDIAMGEDDEVIIKFKEPSDKE